MNTISSKYKMFILQLIGWGVILGISFAGNSSMKTPSMISFELTRLAMNLLRLLLIYTLNYLIFIPKYLFKGRRTNYILYNILIIAILLLSTFFNHKFGIFEPINPEGLPPRPKTNFAFLLRDSINYVLMIGLVTAVRLSERLRKSEEALKEAESARVKAELANLKSQINPHFLLNTLNNIYALTAIDTDKAQKTIKELSDLLRYILYDNQNDKVLLIKEVDFLKTYIELMSIRLPRKVRTDSTFVINADSSTTIAPLIFISLIENAFKHSVSSSGDGFINISLEDRVDKGEITLAITNSNNSKREGDKSGHGIGLAQVERRLKLLYTDNYSWDVSIKDDVYSSILTLKGTSKGIIV